MHSGGGGGTGVGTRVGAGVGNGVGAAVGSGVGNGVGDCVVVVVTTVQFAAFVPLVLSEQRHVGQTHGLPFVGQRLRV